GKGIAWIGQKMSAFLQAHPLVAKIAVGFLAVATAVALIVGPVLTVVGLIGALGGIPAILGAVGAGLASLGAAAGALGAVLSAAFWPVTLIAAGVAALYLAFKYNFLGIRSVAVAVGKVFKDYLLGAWEGVKAALSPLIDTFRETWAVLKDAFAPIWEVVAGIGELVGMSVEGSSSLDSFRKVAGVLGKVVGFVLVMPIRVAATAVAYLVKGFAFLFKGAVSLGQWLAGKLSPYIGKVGTALSYLRGPVDVVIAAFGRIKDAVGAAIDWVAANWSTIKGIILAPVEAIRAHWASLAETLTGAFTTVYDTVTGLFSGLTDAIMGAIDWVWNKVTWVISKIPDVFLPESLEQIKYGRLAEERGAAMGGQLVVPATAPATQRATPRPTLPRDVPAMPALALAGAGGGTIDRSVHIHPGSIVIHANRIDERAAMLIDRELAKLLERRLERQ
ncbi:MAG: phage tail family protein, partial [Planctomycetota bacterium]